MGLARVAVEGKKVAVIVKCHASGVVTSNRKSNKPYWKRIRR